MKSTNEDSSEEHVNILKQCSLFNVHLAQITLKSNILTCLESLIYANKLHLRKYNCTRSASDVKTQVNRIHANYNNLHVKFYRQIFLICVYFLVYFCVYFFTRVFHTCFSRGICVQYGGFPSMKHVCNAAMPVACTVHYHTQKQREIKYINQG